ncbi:hypothetical protein PCK2_000328 [Pneumocystis canis]|nr:hypothetical protein PCK2_000328 [Pneumocystis canis]
MILEKTSQLSLADEEERREVSPVTPAADRLVAGHSSGSPLGWRYSIETTPSNSPLRVRRRREPILFNILVIGFRGSGKTTFVKFLREQLDTMKHQQCSEINDIGKHENGLDQEFTQYCADMEMNGERITVTLWDSSGFGTERDNEIVDLQMNEMMLFVESKFEDTFSEETKLKRLHKNMDTHIHCVFYLIDPTSSYFHYNLSADSLDVSIIRRLSKYTTVIPVISKVDTCTKYRIENIKLEWMKEMEKNDIKFLEFLRDSENSIDESESEYSQEGYNEAHKLLPFGCMSPDWSHENFSSEKKRTVFELCREYPWGKADPRDEKRYLLQGIPLGLVMGSLPYLLQPYVSFTSLGFFSLATYPYSLKLFWSPIVDAVYNEKWGRRKSWIIPIQTTIGICLIWISYNIQNWIEDAEAFLKRMTVAFFILVFLCATQDIVVDGWALTLLSEENLAYASTAQSIGLNTGYFLSFTGFLAFNSAEFINKYFYFIKKDFELISLSEYIWFWGWVFLISTVLIAFFQNEVNEKCSSGGLKSVYLTIFNIMKLRHARLFIFIHLIAKIGFVASDVTLNLKLLEKEDLSAAILINFPLELIFGYYAARWSSISQPLRPWIYAYVGRLFAACLGIFIVYIFPYSGKIDSIYFYIIILQNMLSSFMSTIQFISMNAFHTRIADPMIGGTYMTVYFFYFDMYLIWAELGPEWRNDMREFCKEVLYENWRTDRLEKLGNISLKMKSEIYKVAKQK